MDSKFPIQQKIQSYSKLVMSEEHKVISGVPQGTFLASILFIIIISDIDENLRNSISRLFADDTKVSAKIRTFEDTELLQQDLNDIYKWVDENLMDLNENQICKMSHGAKKNVRIGVYCKNQEKRSTKSKK